MKIIDEALVRVCYQERQPPELTLERWTLHYSLFHFRNSIKSNYETPSPVYFRNIVRI